MPKKSPITPSAIESFSRLAKAARSAHLVFRSIVSGYYMQEDSVRKRAEAILREYDALLKEIEESHPTD